MANFNLDSVLVHATNEAGLVVQGTSKWIPTTANTYAPGCLLTVNGVVYTNAGTAAVPSFQDINSIATSEIADAAVTPAKTNIVQARTATTDGTGTGTISDTATFVTVTSDDANKIVVLPTPTPGREVWLRNAGTGYELRSSAPGTVAINGGTGASAESAIGANVLTRCFCDSATTWVCTNFSTAGTVSATEVAA